MAPIMPPDIISRHIGHFWQQSAAFAGAPAAGLAGAAWAAVAVSIKAETSIQGFIAFSPEPQDAQIPPLQTG